MCACMCELFAGVKSFLFIYSGALEIVEIERIRTCEWRRDASNCTVIVPSAAAATLYSIQLVFHEARYV